MSAPSTSRISGFYKLDTVERRRRISELCQLSADSVHSLDGSNGLSEAVADKMIENVVGRFALPIGLGINFLIDEREYIVPMVVEEPSIVAAVSNVANMVRAGGGFHCEADLPEMIAQVQLVKVPDLPRAIAAIEGAKPELMALGDKFAADMLRFGGGMRDLRVRVLEDSGDGGGPMLVVHLIVDCRDAMGANTVNTVAEGLAPRLQELSAGRAILRILSNLADKRLARATCRIPVTKLSKGQLDGEQVADNIVWAYRFAARDPYRAATHNKGIMNGIDAVAIATGNDWRSLEAGAHAYAARDGRYTSLTKFHVDEGHLHGAIELPMAVGTVGGSTRSHPSVRACREILGVDDAQTLAKIIAAVGLAQNIGALRALAAEGIQQGHMALHARQVALAAGLGDADIDRVAQLMVAKKEFTVELAQQLAQENK